MHSEKKHGDNTTSTNWHFSLLADPTKLNSSNKPIQVHSGDTDSDSIKQNFNSTTNDTNVMFRKPSSKSSNSSDSYSSESSYSTSDSSSSYYSTTNSISVHNTHDKHDKHNKHDKHDTTTHPDIKNNNIKHSEKIDGTSYMHEIDNYDELDENKKRWKRMEVFARLEHFRTEKKVTLTKKYNLDSDYWEMKTELKYITDKQNTKDAVELGIKGLEWFAQGAEFLNRRYDPIGVDLNGWGNHITITKDNYKDIMAELYEKHKDKSRKVEPEVKLIGMIFLSALVFHMSKSAANTPGIGDIIKNNPTLLASAETMMTKKAFPSEKTPEQIQKEREFELYQQYQQQKATVQPMNRPMQPPVQQPMSPMQHPTQQVKQVPTFIGSNHNIAGSAPFSPVMKRPNISNIINNIKKDVNPQTANINQHSDDINISSINPNSRIEISETSLKKNPDLTSNSASNITIRTEKKQRSLEL